MPRLIPSGFFGPCRCLILTPGLTSSTPCAVCVCVCVHTHIHTRALPPASKIEKTPNNSSISPSVKNKPPRQATSALHRQVEPSHPRPPTRMDKLRIHERMCTPCNDCVANMCADVKNTSGTYTPACTHWCPGFLFGAHHAHHKNYTYTRASTPVQLRSNFFTMETIASHRDT